MTMEKQTTELAETRENTVAEAILKGTQATPEVTRRLSTMSENLASLSAEKMTDFVTMMAVAKTTADMRAALCRPELRAFVMAMQGNPIFFRTDAQYPQETVADCIVQGYAFGLPPVGNLFNILGGRFYVTREGVEHKLSKMGVQWSATFGDIQDAMTIKGYVDKRGREHAPTEYKRIPVTVEYLYRGETGRFATSKLVKAAAGWTVENIQGKATRKAAYDLWRLLASSEGVAVPAIQDDDPEEVLTATRRQETINVAKERKEISAGRQGCLERVAAILQQSGAKERISPESFVEWLYEANGVLPSEEGHYTYIRDNLPKLIEDFRAWCEERNRQGKEDA